MSEDEPSWYHKKRTSYSSGSSTTQKSLSSKDILINREKIEKGLENLAQRLPNEHPHIDSEAVKNTKFAIIANKKAIAEEISKDPSLTRFVMERPPYVMGGISFLGISIPRDSRKDAEENKIRIIQIAQRISEQAEEKEAKKEAVVKVLRAAGKNAGALVRHAERKGNAEALFGKKAETAKKKSTVQKRLF